MNDDTFIPETAEDELAELAALAEPHFTPFAKLATLDLSALPQGKLLADTITRELLAFGRFPQSMKSRRGKVCDIIPSLAEEIVGACLDLLGKSDAELVSEARRITRRRIRKEKHEARWRDKNPTDAYCKRCRGKQAVINHDKETRTLTLDCGHTRVIPKDGLQRAKAQWAIEQPQETAEETAPVGIVSGSDDQIDESTGQQFHNALSDVGSDIFGRPLEDTRSNVNTTEDAMNDAIDKLKEHARYVTALEAIGPENYRWLLKHYGRVGKAPNADYQKCFRLCEKIRQSLKSQVLK
jgi:hypothetical protein